MSIWRRAYLHTIRKKGKTALLFFILLVVSTMILTCIAVDSATDTAAGNIRKALMGGFTINATHVDELLEDELASKILKIPGMSGNYNFRSYYRAEYRGKNGNKLAIKTEGAETPLKGYEHVGKIVGSTHSDMDTYFTENGFKLKEGRHISEGDKNVILVSDEFAEANGLKLGDRIVLGDNHVNRQAEVEIIGIFTPTKAMDAVGLVPAEELYENVSFTDQETYSQLYFNDGRQHYQYSDFYVEDPAALDQVINKVKNIAGMEWGKCNFTKNDAEYQNSKSALEGLQKLVRAIVTILILISTVMLTLILLLWSRSRIHEIGALLAMGIGKGNIILQHMTEVLLIAVLAFALSFGVSSLMAQKAGDALLDQTTAEDHVTEKNVVDGTSKEVEKEEPYTLESIEVKVSLTDLLLLYGIGCGIIVLSIGAASYPVMRLKPKQILTKMS